MHALLKYGLLIALIFTEANGRSSNFPATDDLTTSGVRENPENSQKKTQASEIVKTAGIQSSRSKSGSTGTGINAPDVTGKKETPAPKVKPTGLPEVTGKQRSFVPEVKSTDKNIKDFSVTPTKPSTKSTENGQNRETNSTTVSWDKVSIVTTRGTTEKPRERPYFFGNSNYLILKIFETMERFQSQPKTGSKQATSTQHSCSVDLNVGHVDLSPLGKKDGTPKFKNYADPDNAYAYSWNPCYPFSSGDACQNVELCQTDEVATGMSYDLGEDSTSQFQVQDNQLFLVYQTRDPTLGVVRTSYIELICEETEEGEFQVVGENPSTVYHFQLWSKYACPREASTPATPTSQPGPTPSPGIFSLKTIVILLGCILGSICALMFLVFVGLITRRSKTEQKCSSEKEKMKF